MKLKNTTSQKHFWIYAVISFLSFVISIMFRVGMFDTPEKYDFDLSNSLLFIGVMISIGAYIELYVSKKQGDDSKHNISEDGFYDSFYPWTIKHEIAELALKSEGVFVFRIHSNNPEKPWGYGGCGLKNYYTKTHAVQAAYLSNFGIDEAQKLFG